MDVIRASWQRCSDAGHGIAVGGFAACPTNRDRNCAHRQPVVDPLLDCGGLLSSACDTTAEPDQQTEIAMTDSTNTSDQITPEMIEGALKDLQSDVNSKAPSMLTKIAYVAGTAAMGITAVAYLLGRRSGRRRSSLIEVRRL